MDIAFSSTYAVILAGGSGTRFWPVSRQASPKQLCKILDPDKTMIELTLDRLDGLVPPNRRIIVTHESQAQATAKIVGDQCHHILVEPMSKNTAAALALAAFEIQHLAEASGISDPVMISLHADHAIVRVDIFQNKLKEAIHVAQQEKLTLLGVRPSYPETGYGYMEQGPSLGFAEAPQSYRVESFREKPAKDVAQSYVDSGKFYWNSGMFVWKVSVFLRELGVYLPQTVTHLREYRARPEQHDLVSIYSLLPGISVDHALLEKSKCVALLVADFGWQDVGSWASLNRVLHGDVHQNLMVGPSEKVIVLDSKNTTIQTDGVSVAVLGVQDLVVVVSNGAVLVCHKDRAQDVKAFVDIWKERGRMDLV